VEAIDQLEHFGAASHVRDDFSSLFLDLDG